MTRGLIIGKFYPPHKGHSLLIETALKRCDDLAIIVCAKNKETIPGKLRAEWLKELHPQARVILTDTALPGDDSAEWAKYTLRLLGYAPDILFTSEEYGDRYAPLIGAKHILVDKERTKFPVSGTLVRKNPFAYWKYLASPVRAYFAKSNPSHPVRHCEQRRILNAPKRSNLNLKI